MKTYDDSRHAAGCGDCQEDCVGEMEKLLACLKWRIEDVEQDRDAFQSKLEAVREICTDENFSDEHVGATVRIILNTRKGEVTKRKVGECYDPQRCSNCGKDVDEAPHRITGGTADEDEWFCSSYCYDEHARLGCPFETGDQYRDCPDRERSATTNAESAEKGEGTTYDCEGAMGPEGQLDLPNPAAATMEEIAEALTKQHPDTKFYVGKREDGSPALCYKKIITEVSTLEFIEAEEEQ